MKKNYYEEFINLYGLSKTLRFELKPIGKTEKLLEESNGEIFGKDKRYGFPVQEEKELLMID